MRASSAALVFAFGVLLVACNSGSSAGHPPPVVQQPDDPSHPFGITAIDYHFHDTHPSIPLMPDRSALWTNQGGVLHNVTIPGLEFSKDIAPGEGFTIKDLGQKLGGPGVYTFFCAYHRSVGMTGVIVIRGLSSIPTVPPSLLPASYSPVPVSSATP